jgi:pimeloyl-ACP methyl ester carboxylesterase
LLKKLDIDDRCINLVGHSFGGRICIKAVSERILSPDKIVLIGSAGVKHSESLRNMSYRLVAKSGKAFLSLPGLSRYSHKARKRLYESTGSTDYVQSGTMKDIFLATINEDLSQNAPKITVPTLLVWGEDDDQAPIEDARFFRGAIPNSELKVIDRERVISCITNIRSKVNRWIKDFSGC